MYEFETSAEIAASPARVWRALCDPAQVVQWDSGVERAIDAPADYPRPGQHVRWRYRYGPFRLLHDRPQQVDPERTLRSLLALGPLRMDETYTLAPNRDGTRLAVRMTVRAALPLAGVLVARAVGPASRRTVEASLRAIKRHCEGG